MFSRKYSCGNTKMADKLGYCAIIWESVRQVDQSIIEESVIEAFECTYYQRYLLSGLVYVHEVYTGTE